MAPGKTACIRNARATRLIVFFCMEFSDTRTVLAPIFNHKKGDFRRKGDTLSAARENETTLARMIGLVSDVFVELPKLCFSLCEGKQMKPNSTSTSAGDKGTQREYGRTSSLITVAGIIFRSL